MLTSAGVAINPRPFKVMFCGDSLTVGVGDATTLAAGGYKTQLISGINSRIKRAARFVGSQSNIGNMCGASGRTVAQLNADPYLVVQAPQYTPDIYFIHIGTNDCTQRNTTGTPTLDTSRAALTTLLDNIRTATPSGVVFVARIIDNQTAHDEVVEYNSTAIDIDVPARADYQAGLIHIVDMYTAVGPWSTTTFADGSHLNTAGYTLMSDGWQTDFNLYY